MNPKELSQHGFLRAAERDVDGVVYVQASTTAPAIPTRPPKAQHLPPPPPALPPPPPGLRSGSGAAPRAPPRAGGNAAFAGDYEERAYGSGQAPADEMRPFADRSYGSAAPPPSYADLSTAARAALLALCVVVALICACVALACVKRCHAHNAADKSSPSAAPMFTHPATFVPDGTCRHFGRPGAPCIHGVGARAFLGGYTAHGHSTMQTPTPALQSRAHAQRSRDRSRARRAGARGLRASHELAVSPRLSDISESESAFGESAMDDSGVMHVVVTPAPRYMTHPGEARRSCDDDDDDAMRAKQAAAAPPRSSDSAAGPDISAYLPSPDVDECAHSAASSNPQSCGADSDGIADSCFRLPLPLSADAAVATPRAALTPAPPPAPAPARANDPMTTSEESAAAVISVREQSADNRHCNNSAADRSYAAEQRRARGQRAARYHGQRA